MSGKTFQSGTNLTMRRSESLPHQLPIYHSPCLVARFMWLFTKFKASYGDLLLWLSHMWHFTCLDPTCCCLQPLYLLVEDNSEVHLKRSMFLAFGFLLCGSLRRPGVNFVTASLSQDFRSNVLQIDSFALDCDGHNSSLTLSAYLSVKIEKNIWSAEIEKHTWCYRQMSKCEEDFLLCYIGISLTHLYCGLSLVARRGARPHFNCSLQEVSLTLLM